MKNHSNGKTTSYQEEKQGLNLKILEITMNIQVKYPELYEYLGEMTITIPDKQNPQIDINNLREYYDSLTSLLGNYIREHAH